MKRITLIIFLSPLFFACSTQKHVIGESYPNPFQFSVIDSCADSKNDLFVKANEWVATSFVSAKDVIQMSDKEAGKIIVKGVMQCNESAMFSAITAYVKFTLSIDVKDRKYRMKISDYYADEIVFSGSKPATYHPGTPLESNKCFCLWPKNWNGVKNTCFLESKEFVSSFNKSMKAKINSNW